MKIFKILLVIILCCCFLPCGCGKKERVIVLGVAAPFTGELAQFGESIKNAVELALSEINQSGGVLGYKIEYIIGDDKADPKEAVSVAQRLVTINNIIAVIGHFNSGCSIPASEIYDANGIIQLTPASTNPRLTERGLKFVFRNLPNDNENGRQLAEFAVNRLNAKRILIIYANNAYGKGLADIFEKRATELGANILSKETYDPAVDVDFRPIISKWLKIEADVICISGETPKGAIFIKQAREMGIKLPFIGGDGIDSSELWKIAGDGADGVCVTSYFHYTDDRQEAQDFVRKYKDKYNDIPDVWAAQSYDAVYLLVEAIRNANSIDRGLVRDSLAKIKDFPGVTGRTTFDENGDVIGKKVIIKKVEGDKFVLY
ncbi:MAG: branched-chain amino acid ABC transporter substrate-binding protein [Candidatus Hydrogenedentota bacterium]